jgi:DNA-binding CsgD family transcriptional regulator
VEHLKIAYCLLALLVGTAAIVYALLRGRGHRLPFVKPFAWFLGFNNLLALINLTSAYACANLLGFSALFRYSVFARVLGPAARLSQVGIVYALFAVARGLRGRRLSRAFNLTFGLFAGILLASYVVGGALPRGSASRLWLARGQLAVFGLGVLAMLGVLLRLLLDSRNIPDAAERKAVRIFGASYLTIYAVFVITFPLPTGAQFFPNALALLAINIVPFIWFGRLFDEAYAATPASGEDREALERFCRARGLSSREADILDLVLRGRSNAQIEKELFISIHTVKNHITNIYQKMGVRSRWQLISLFHSGRQERPSAGPLPSGLGRTPEKDVWHE